VSRPRFLADHDLNEKIIVGVLRREPSLELVRVRECDLHEAPDAVVLQYAAERGLMVVSHDVNTMVAAAVDRVSAGEAMPGLFMIQQGDPIGPVIENLVLIWSASEAEEWHNQIVFLPLA
jgi:predicted nuclease of predicted toxin-antitoxin system